MSDAQGKAGSLFFGMTLDTKEFKKNMKDARKRMKAFGKMIREDIGKIANGFKVAAAGAGLASGAMLLFSKETLDAVKAQVLLAESIGVTQAEIAGLTLLTNEWGVETDMVIDKMREFGGLEEFKRLADEVKNAGDEQAQLNKAVELFGGEGAKMLAILQQGSAGFEAMTQRARELGLALSPRQVEESRVVWEQLSDTWDHIRGIATQIGQRLIKPLGLLAAGVKGFIVTFKSEILGGFEFAADVIEGFVRGAFNLFAKFGIPFINGFIQFANQIGQAFQTLFDWLSPTAESTLGSLSSFFTKIIDFMATIKDSMVFGISKVVTSTINGLFFAIEKVRDFIAFQVETIAAFMEGLGLEDEGFTDAVVQEFRAQGQRLEKARQGIVQPFVEAQKEAFDNMVDIIGENIKKNEEQAARFKGILSDFEISFGDAVVKAGKKSGEAVAKAVTMGVSTNLAGMVQRGSQEEARILNSANNPMLVESKKQTVLLGDIDKKFSDIGVF
jgi:hypothetical protein